MKVKLNKQELNAIINLDSPIELDIDESIIENGKIEKAIKEALNDNIIELIEDYSEELSVVCEDEPNIEIVSCKMPVYVEYLNADGEEESAEIEVDYFKTPDPEKSRNLFEQDVISVLQDYTGDYNIEECLYEILNKDLANTCKLDISGSVKEIL